MFSVPFETASEAHKWPRLVKLEANLYGAAFSIMKLIPASFIIERAEASGQIGPETLVVESTSGTFGLALAMVCAERGHRLTIVGDDAIDSAMRMRIESLGAELLYARKPARIGGIQQARLDLVAELRRRNPDHYWPEQYENPANSASYGELAVVLKKALGRIDCLVGTVGTGGSMCGTADALRSSHSGLWVVGVDTHGSVLFGQPDRPGRLLRGLGNSLLPRNVDQSVFDEVHWISAADAFRASRELYRRHALFMGPTSGAAWLVASWWARRNPGAVVVTLLPDEGHRYQSTVYNPDWISARSLSRPHLPDGPRMVDDPLFVEEAWTRLMWRRRSLGDVLAERAGGSCVA
jgi:cysteine synthase A